MVSILRVGIVAFYLASAVLSALALRRINKITPVVISPWDAVNVVFAVIAPVWNTYDAVLFWSAVIIAKKRKATKQ